VSRRQQAELEELLKALRSDTSTLKDMAMRLAGRLEPLLPGVTADDMPKHCIAAHSWEQFEIGPYCSTLGAAEELGMRPSANVRALHTRRAGNGKRLLRALPAITRQYLGEYARP
jgi:ferritin-like metal-binding protein YciE